MSRWHSLWDVGAWPGETVPKAYVSHVAISDDASGGKIVIGGRTANYFYVTEYQITNRSGGGLTFYLASSPASTTERKYMNVLEYLATVSTLAPRTFAIPLRAPYEEGVGFIASAAGDVELRVSGFYSTV